ncbi:MAG: S4 domain-containing protein, partial [Oscillospiraceae bacterium]
MDERIQKVMSEQGFCSRRAAEKLIEQGRVLLNGRAVSLGDKMDARRDVLSVDGQRLELQKNTEKKYYMLHKPRGFVTTLSDSHAAKTVA